MSSIPPPPPSAPGPFGDDPKATAKAAKAYAKAQRPWYKKKRFILPVIVIVIGIAASAGGGDDKSGGGTGGDGPKSDLSTNTDNPPGADVEASGACTVEFGIVSLPLKVTNHSSKTSDYIINVGIEDSTGAKVGDGFATVDNVDPGQSANIEATGTASDQAQEPLTCTVEEVERFAS